MLSSKAAAAESVLPELDAASGAVVAAEHQKADHEEEERGAYSAKRERDEGRNLPLRSERC